MWFFKNYWILGQNARNLHYISEYNDDLAKKLADSKLKTKEFLSNKWVRISENIAVLKNHTEWNNFDLNSLPLPFVIKPNAWYGWKWILVFDTKDENGNFISNDHQIFSLQQLKDHTNDILDWFYSLSWSRDSVIFEHKIVLDHSIELLWKFWLPDIRVIVFNSIPVIAMLRVPTQNSKWKANLHMGACWLGIDIWSGKITYITQFKKMIKSIPWIGDVRWIEIPQWEEILKLAVKVQQITNIWYVGCDIVLDNTFGPILLEMNVRPGLEVQVANKIPLLERLKKVSNIKVNSVEKWVRLARDLFGWDIEEKIKNISGKKVLWVKEYIEIYIHEKPIKSICEIRIIKSQSYINKGYLINFLKYDENKITSDFVKLRCSLMWEIRNIKFYFTEIVGPNILLWRDVLGWFLIDPFKYKEHDLPIDNHPFIKEKNTVILKWHQEQLMKLDKEIVEIDKKLNILKIITPKNIPSEMLKFVHSQWQYIPQLEYNEMTLDIANIFKKVSDIEIPDIPLSQIYKKKKEEIIDKLYFLKAFQDQNIKDLNKYSKILYGDIIGDNLEYALNILQEKEKIIPEIEFLTFDEIKTSINTFNHIYWIQIELKEKHIVSRFMMSGNKLCIKPGAKVGKKEIRSIIAHEIEWHYLRKYNGLKSKYTIFSHGTAWYQTIEEWIATYNQNKFLTKTDLKYFYNLERYYFIDFYVKNNYQELLEEFKKQYSNDYETIFRYLVRMKRWIKNIGDHYCFTKDLVYLNGYMEVKNFIHNGWNINELYFWKINLEDLEQIKKSEFLDMKIDDLKIPLFI